MVMRANKHFIVIAYDISNTRRRNKIVKLLSEYGRRVNLSVFECMLTDSQFLRLKKDIASLTIRSKDRIIYYPLCLDCYSKIEYHPDLHHEDISSVGII